MTYTKVNDSIVREEKTVATDIDVKKIQKIIKTLKRTLKSVNAKIKAYEAVLAEAKKVGCIVKEEVVEDEAKFENKNKIEAEKII